MCKVSGVHSMRVCGEMYAPPTAHVKGVETDSKTDNGDPVFGARDGAQSD